MQERQFGEVLNPIKIYAHRPSILRGIVNLIALIDESGLIEPQLKYMVEANVASINGCEFCTDFNSAMAIKNGASIEKLHALRDFISSRLFTEREKLALEWAQKVTILEFDSLDEVFQRLKAEFTEAEIVELTAMIAVENALSRFNRALKIGSQNFMGRVMLERSMKP